MMWNQTLFIPLFIFYLYFYSAYNFVKKIICSRWHVPSVLPWSMSPAVVQLIKGQTLFKVITMNLVNILKKKPLKRNIFFAQEMMSWICNRFLLLSPCFFLFFSASTFTLECQISFCNRPDNDNQARLGIYQNTVQSVCGKMKRDPSASHRSCGWLSSFLICLSGLADTPRPWI